MQLTKKLEIQSKQKIIEFLNIKPVGRMDSIDVNSYPQVIPMNFVYLQANKTHVRSQGTIKSDTCKANYIMSRIQFNTSSPWHPSIYISRTYNSSLMDTLMTFQQRIKQRIEQAKVHVLYWTFNPYIDSVTLLQDQISVLVVGKSFIDVHYPLHYFRVYSVIRS